MPEQGYAFFIKRPRRIEDLRRVHPTEQERKYETAKVITLAKTDYENFVTDLLVDRRFLEDNASLCSGDGNVIRCLKVTCRGCKESVLVVPRGAWVEIAAPSDEREA